MGSSDLMVRSARQTYGLVGLVVVGLLLVGLLVPLAFGDPSSGVTTSNGAPSPAPTGDSGTGVQPGASTPTTGPPPTTAGAEAPAQDETGGPGGAASPSTADTRPLTASDVGVSASTIKIGVVLLDLDALEPLGLGVDNFSVDAQRSVFQVYIDDINARGGINGRQVEATYVRNDPLDPGAARARCVELAKDRQVFAVLGFVTDELTCLLQEQRRPTVGYTNYPRSYFTGSGHYLVTGQPTSERLAANWAGAMDELGTLQGRTIGIVSGESEFEVVPADALQATLEQLGHKIAYRTRLSADEGTATAQLPIEVQRMQSAGVDTVFLSTNFVAARTWVETARSQRWTPQYLVSEVGQLSSDDLAEAMPDSFDGALGIVNGAGGIGARSVRAGEPERPENAACRTLYNGAASGPDYAYGESSPIANVCPIVQIFERAAKVAGPELTRDGFAGAVQSLGSFPLPAYPSGSFGPGKSDYNDAVQPVRWKASCHCYDIAGPLMRGRF